MFSDKIIYFAVIACKRGNLGMNNKTINKHYVYGKYMDKNLPDKTVLDVSDKFKSILGFKIENITFKRNDFKIESRGYRNPSVSLHLEKERKVELRLKYNLE